MAQRAHPLVSEVLEQLGISQYLDVFIDQGFDTWDTILDITESDLDALGVKLGHRRKLQRRIANFRGISAETALVSPIRAATEETPRQETPHKQAVAPASGLNIDSHGPVPGVLTKRRYRRHPKPDECAPERPPSAYVLFSNKMREDLKERNLSFTEIAKLVGENWQTLTPAEREPFESQAQAAKDKYSHDFSEYKKTPEYKKYMLYLQDFKAKHANQTQENKDAFKRIKLSSFGSSSSPSISSGMNSAPSPPASAPRERQRAESVSCSGSASGNESHHDADGAITPLHREQQEYHDHYGRHRDHRGHHDHRVHHDHRGHGDRGDRGDHRDHRDHREYHESYDHRDRRDSRLGSTASISDSPYSSTSPTLGSLAPQFNGRMHSPTQNAAVESLAEHSSPGLNMGSREAMSSARPRRDSAWVYDPHRSEHNHHHHQQHQQHQQQYQQQKEHPSHQQQHQKPFPEARGPSESPMASLVASSVGASQVSLPSLSDMLDRHDMPNAPLSANKADDGSGNYAGHNTASAATSKPGVADPRPTMLRNDFSTSSGGTNGSNGSNGALTANTTSTSVTSPLSFSSNYPRTPLEGSLPIHALLSDKPAQQPPPSSPLPSSSSYHRRHGSTASHSGAQSQSQSQSHTVPSPPNHVLSPARSFTQPGVDSHSLHYKDHMMDGVVHTSGGGHDLN